MPRLLDVATALVAGALACAVATLPGCAQLAAALPAVLAVVQDAALIIDTIDSFTRVYFAAHPDPARQAEVGRALARARGALDAAVRAGRAAGEVQDGKANAALADFRVAYADLLALVAPIGVHAARPGYAAAGPGELVVPTPIAMGGAP